MKSANRSAQIIFGTNPANYSGNIFDSEINKEALRLHKGRLETYGRLLVACKDPTIQTELLRRASCQQRDVKYIDQLVRKGCLERQKLNDSGDWSRIRYILTEKGKTYAEYFEKVMELLE